MDRKSVRALLSNLQKEECIPNYIQQAWDSLKWFSTKFQTLDVTATQRLASKKKWLQETLVSATTPERKAVVAAKEVILALEEGAVAGGADPQGPGRPLMPSFWEWSDFKWGVVLVSMTFNTRAQVQ